MEADTTLYGQDIFQSTLISYIISDPDTYARVQNIVKEDYFNNEFRPAVRMIKAHTEKYGAIPRCQQIMAETNVRLEPIGDFTDADIQYVLEHTEAFCRFRALEEIIFAGPGLLAKGEGAEMEKKIRDAMTISLISDLGSSYFENVRERLNRLKDKSNYISTGWRELDRKLNGGFTKGSLNIFCGGSGSGKSLFLQNIALNWAIMGLNVIYITLELSEDLSNQRLDSMTTGLKTSEVLRHIDEVALKVNRIKKTANGGSGAGDLRVKKFSEAGTTSNDIRAYLKEYQIQFGRKPDAILVDYLDLMHPNNPKIDVSNLFTKDKFVAEELRAIGVVWDIPVVSASQLNRSSTEAQEYDHSHIAGGISKINTADNVFGIFTSLTMRESGRYQIQFLKTRSAGSVGMKCELAFDRDSLRIFDPPEIDDEPEQDNKQIAQAAISSINPISPTPPPNPRTAIDDMLKRFKSDSDK